MLGPESVGALESMGLRAATPFQEAAIPIILRGNAVAGRISPASGALFAYGAPLLERIPAGAMSPSCLVLCAGTRESERLARGLLGLARAGNRRVAALEPGWRSPEKADMLFVSATHAEGRLRSVVDPASLSAIVLHDGDGILRVASEERIEALFGELSRECQRIILSFPFGPKLLAFARRFCRRAVPLPTGVFADRAKPKSRAPRRRDARTLHVAARGADSLVALRETATSLLETGETKYLLVFGGAKTNDASVSRDLEAHGFLVGEPGDLNAEVWLADEDGEDVALKEAASAARAGFLATVSLGPPANPLELSRRHELGGPAWIILRPRDTRYLEEVAAASGFSLKHAKAERPGMVAKQLDALADRLRRAAASPEIAPYHLLVEALEESIPAGQAAAAALMLLDAHGRTKEGHRAAATWVRLFFSTGSQDGVDTRALVTALIQDAEIPPDHIGRVEVKERHSLADVREADARAAISRLNGTTMSGRAVRVDYDRGPRARAGARPKPHDQSRSRPKGRRAADKGRRPSTPRRDRR